MERAVFNLLVGNYKTGDLLEEHDAKAELNLRQLGSGMPPGRKNWQAGIAKQSWNAHRRYFQEPKTNLHSKRDLSMSKMAALIPMNFYF